MRSVVTDYNMQSRKNNAGFSLRFLFGRDCVTYLSGSVLECEGTGGLWIFSCQYFCDISLCFFVCYSYAVHLCLHRFKCSRNFLS